MDGGGRLLGSLTEALSGLAATARPRFAGVPDGFAPGSGTFPAPLRRMTLSRRSTGSWLVPRSTRGGMGLMLTVVMFSATGLFGAVRGGQYADFVRQDGSPLDIAARVFGFPIRAITISGIKELDGREILAAAGIGPNSSLLFLDAAAVRDRLKAVPLVKDAVVTKLFPDRLTVAVDERNPRAIWQDNGHLSIVSGDGVVIDTVTDDRFNGLPFVVGAGANARVHEFRDLLDAAGDLRGRIVAGILVAERRWSLKMDNGLVVELPEDGAAAAVTRLAALDRGMKLLDKDLVSIDLRLPNRVTVRLSEDAAAARAAMLAKKPKPKGPSE